ncbi:hypothetical protein Mth01_39250 [Sphaerimonospora thailandensis]|uniref:HEAT repeat protein n=1 Tax=Sphaerimonospora thailandensis TaxID=795644 RepID=A0A8J3W0J0_9ACTN|nr:hypothetical protein Mth01_39250 [Sphaerimonospora thailandensis]
MTMPKQDLDTIRAFQGLEDGRSPVRLQAALAVGTTPDPRFIDKLIERCAVEPDFYVRDMLTWALTRHSASMTVPKLIDELRSARVQARSQALHTLVQDRRPASMAGDHAGASDRRRRRGGAERLASSGHTCARR